MPILPETRSKKKQERLTRQFVSGKLSPQDYVKKALPLEEEGWDIARKKIMRGTKMELVKS